MCVCVGGLERAVTVQQRQGISLNVPFWMAARAGKNVTRKRPVPSITESGTNALRFLTSHKNVHSPSSLFDGTMTDAVMMIFASMQS